MLRIAVFLMAAPLFAGGFWLEMGSVEASPEAKAHNATLVVRAVGCHDPAKAEISGVAIRVVDGHKQSTPLKLIPLKAAGAYAVLRDWPGDTLVTLEFVGHNEGMSTSMLVRARNHEVEKASAKFFPRVPTSEEEDMAVLKQ